MFNRRLMTMPFLGFASGLPLALTSGTLQAWLTVAGLDIQAIGFFSLIGVPYTLKFLWSPAMDRYTPDYLGRRRGWLISTQVVLLIAIGFLSRLNPLEHIGLLAFAALTIAFLSASQDIAFDAYRADVLRARERGLGVALSVIGYRIGMLVSGALALIIADRMGWSMTYLTMAAFILFGVVATLWSEEPERPADAPATMLDAIAEPLRQFFSRTNALVLLVLIVLYKLGDAFAGSLTTAFLIGGMKFTLSDVGIINKGLGLGCSLLGVALGGALMIRWGMYRSLVAFAVLQGVSNLGFWALAWLGKNYALLALVIALENLSGGMGTAAFVALLMGLCDPRYTATQYALLSAIASLSRVFVGPASGQMVAVIGWANFFLVTFVVSLPVFWLLYRVRLDIASLHAAR